MPLGDLKKLLMLSSAEGFPSGVTGGRFVIFAAVGSGVGSLTLDPADFTVGTNDIRVNDQITDGNKKYALGTRLTFPTIGFTSTPQIAANQVVWVVETNGDNVRVSDKPYNPAGTNTVVDITDAGASATSVRDLNVIETIGGVEFSVMTTADARRYEIDLGVSVDRSSWVNGDTVLDVLSANNPAFLANQYKAVIKLAQLGDDTPAGEGTVQPPGDITYAAIIFIETHPGSGLDSNFSATAIATKFDPGGMVSASALSSGTLLGGGSSSIRAEFSF